jgi:serpin B
MMMHRRGSMALYDQGPVRLLVLPMDDEAEILLLLPGEGSELEATLALLDHQRLSAWRQEAREREVDLRLPRLDLSAGGSLVEALKSLGLSTVFGQRADFTGLADDPTLYIAEVIQRCRLQVDEQGVKAAAVTGVVVATKSMPMSVPFHCDRPFLLMLRHAPSGLILLTARISDPRG